MKTFEGKLVSVKDEAGSSEQPNLVIKGEFKGMGPLAIFTKDAK